MFQPDIFILPSSLEGNVIGTSKVPFQETNPSPHQMGKGTSACCRGYVGYVKIPWRVNHSETSPLFGRNIFKKVYFFQETTPNFHLFHTFMYTYIHVYIYMHHPFFSLENLWENNLQ